MKFPCFDDFLSANLRRELLLKAEPVPGVENLRQLGKMGGLESSESLRFLCEVYERVAPDLDQLLRMRVRDRKFIDQRTSAFTKFNKEFGLEITDDDYRTVLGLEDQDARVVIGPIRENYWRRESEREIQALPDYLQGVHVTLFGPPDSAKMCINAMNAWHRKLPGEAPIVAELLESFDCVPKWGADDEDSKTPLREDLISAGENLSSCFDGELEFEETNGKKYSLASEKLALPIKRFPGLAMPCPFLFYRNLPLPLHLYDFALHFFRNWNRPEALVFYVPKLENEEEARYVRSMLEVAEELLFVRHPEYKKGSIRLMIVLENPRAVFRAHEIMDELFPYFAGASLGWHDFLASTARLFKNDPNYRIPPKADPDIVIKYIKASHELLANVVGPRGGIKVGGMYGILPLTNDTQSLSFQTTIKGYIRDVVTQLKRRLNGFWVAHPDFVRIGMALVEAWRLHAAGDSSKLEALVKALLQPHYHAEILDFIHGPDIDGLDPSHPRYGRSMIVADLKVSEVIPNHDPEEIRYNVFQSLQYLTDWLSGNGCVALPAHVGGVSVRVMDDLATAERSRWEVWHEIHHGRVSLKDFLKICFEEMHFIRKDLSNDKKIVQVKYDERTARWYAIAFKLMLKLMTDPVPPEFATELLLPLTLDEFRQSQDPWALLQKMDPEKYRLEKEVERFCYYFECCGHADWAEGMAAKLLTDFDRAETSTRGFTLADCREAAYFHGNIGEAKATLDARAAGEQSAVINDVEDIRRELLQLGNEYQKRFQIKFLISAQGLGAAAIRDSLKERLGNSPEQELENAREALWQITKKRLVAEPLNSLAKDFEALRLKHRVSGAQIAFCDGSEVDLLKLGEASSGIPVKDTTLFQIASLSKPIAAAFALQYFREHKISLGTKVNDFLKALKVDYRVQVADGLPNEWADELEIRHLLSHEALNLHYVNGYPSSEEMPKLHMLLNELRIVNRPGTRFQYSGGGFLLLEYLLESHSAKSIQTLLNPWLRDLDLSHLNFEQRNERAFEYAAGFTADGIPLSGGRKNFPAIAAGAMGSAKSMLEFLAFLSRSHADPDAIKGISYDSARLMAQGQDLGSEEFMGALMGLGIFVLEAGPNRFFLHQGANDGFRALCLYCFQGPDLGRALVVFVNAELNGVQFIAELSQKLLIEMKIHGVDTEKFRQSFELSRLRSEEIVNVGYRELIFQAFQKDLPEAIEGRERKDEMAEWNRVIGGRIVSCSNQKFARAENLLSPYLPVFEADLYGAQGKVMDSWESARHSRRGFEDLVIELREPSRLAFVSFSTEFHNGNHVPRVSLEATESDKDEWLEILEPVNLSGHAQHYYRIEKFQSKKFLRLRIRTFPDGGLSRMGIFDEKLPANFSNRFQNAQSAQPVISALPIPQTKKPLSIPVDLSADFTARIRKRIPTSDLVNIASVVLGAQILEASNEHYGPALQVISPFAPINMFDGFESARSRKEGHHEFVIIQLAKASLIERIDFDFSYFVNNNPRAVAVDCFDGQSWLEVISPTSVKEFAASEKRFWITEKGIVSDRLRVRIFPDGGINRIRVWTKNQS